MPTTTTGKASELITFSRTSNATLVDSDGRIKWAPHNLLTNSESFDAASWSKYLAPITANAQAAPNGTTTADTVTTSDNNSGLYRSLTVLSGASYTLAFWAKRGTMTDAKLYVVDATNSADIVPVTSYYASINSSTWTLVTQTFTVPSNCVDITFYLLRASLSTGTIHFWGAHLYRSDLGGMKANTSAYPMYNPTTPKNLLGFSEDFSNAGWTKANIAAFGSGSVSNAILAPNGLQTADKIVASSSASATRAIYQIVTPVSGSTYVVSVYAKSAEYSNLALQDISAGRFGATFDLTAQTSTSLGGGGYVSSSITPVSDGWFRCSVTWTGSGVAAVTMIGYPASTTAFASGTSYAGDGVSGIYLWGAQLSDSASLDAYVPNYGAAPTAAAYYGPRLDFDGATLAAKGLLVEEQRVNRIRYSRTLETTSSYWTSVASGTANTVTIDNAPGPDGLSTSASLLTFNTAVTGAGTYSLWRHSLTTTANGTWTFTVWLKAGTTSSVYLRFGDNAGNRANTLCTLTSSWQRFTVTGTTTASITSISCDIGADGNAGGQTLTAGTVYAYGAQLELGAFATSYIPNGSEVAGATRNPDVASVSTQAFPYSSTEGTLVMNGSVLSTTAGNRGAFTLASVSGYISIGNNVSGLGATNADFYTLPAGTFLIASGAVTAGTPFKEAAVYKANDFALSVNGAAAVTSSSGALPTAVTDAYIGRTGSSSAYFNGHIRQITYLPRRVTNAELQTRTA